MTNLLVEWAFCLATGMSYHYPWPLLNPTGLDAARISVSDVSGAQKKQKGLRDRRKHGTFHMYPKSIISLGSFNVAVFAVVLLL